MLGFDEDGWALRANTFGPGKGPIWLADLECTGLENDLEECESFNWAGHRCRHDQDAVVWCANKTRSNDTAVRLEGGKFKWDGRLEVRHKGEWGTVCDNLFDELDADVVCRKMGFNYGGTVLRNAMYGKGDIRVWLDALECKGDETDISFCPFEEWGTTNCSHDNDVGIYCRTSANRTHLAGLSERDIFLSYCRRFAWDVRLYLPPLIDEYPDFNVDDIYMGTEKCKGFVDGPYLKFQHSFGTCHTAMNITSGSYIYYTNTIIYAASHQDSHAGHGPGSRDVRLSLEVTCKWARSSSALENFFHIQNPDKNNPYELPSTSAPISWNSVEIELYTDPHFHNLKPVYGSRPGDLIYVKAYSRIEKHDVKMKIKQCFLTTHPKDRNVYYIMRDSCMLDPNAAIISEKTHETKFYFEDMQFSNNPRSLYIICSFTICNALEHNSTCDQSCDTQKHGGHHRSRTITLAAAPLEANDETDNIISKPIREDVGASLDVAYPDLPLNLQEDLPNN
ncbi:deleted in malignant brain tumors 1 protein-like [Ostrea edulis]|uniref:deleted in malignant brain tumors 1 protein-like n=1 Tax=Ostrea edulis TaxID=37623 RepID=UPI0024AFB33B|nr:deleted in malignant brain tumors 1 protein-like [Ostrea edulis]